MTTTGVSTSTSLSLGGYNVTPVRSDGQRVTFRLTLPDSTIGEVAFSPADTAISLVEPSIELVRPDGQSVGVGIFTAAANDAFFSSYCKNSLGGNCTPKTSESIADGNRAETFTRTDGAIVTRVVFGPWAMIVHGREIADAFSFRGGPDGFPLVEPRTAGFTIKNPYVRVYTNSGPPYLLRQDPSGSCTGLARTALHCDRGLTIESVSNAASPTVHRIN